MAGLFHCDVRNHVLWAWSRFLGFAIRGCSCYSILGVVPATKRKEKSMSRFRKLTNSIWHCQYHLVWVPKYRYRILTGPIGEEVKATLLIIAGWMKIEAVELSVMVDHSHGCAYPAKTGGIRGDGRVEGSDGDTDIPESQAPAQEAILRKLLLNTRIPCGYSWGGRGDDPPVRQVAGEKRATRRRSAAV